MDTGRLSYASQGLSDTGQLQLRRSRRVARLNERDLNPNLVYLGDFNARRGNPDLQPVNNDLMELARVDDPTAGILAGIALPVGRGDRG